MSLTEIRSPPKPAAMGRPPLGNESTNVRLPKDLKARVIARVGTYGLAKFIRQAMEEKLERDEGDQTERRERAKKG